MDIIQTQAIVYQYRFGIITKPQKNSLLITNCICRLTASLPCLQIGEYQSHLQPFKLSLHLRFSCISPTEPCKHHYSTPPNCSSSAHSPTYLPSGTSLKLVKKILDLEFIEMTELVPDSWRAEEGDYQCCSSHNHRTPRRGPVTNILL